MVTGVWYGVGRQLFKKENLFDSCFLGGYDKAMDGHRDLSLPLILKEFLTPPKKSKGEGSDFFAEKCFV